MCRYTYNSYNKSLASLCLGFKRNNTSQKNRADGIKHWTVYKATTDNYNKTNDKKYKTEKMTSIYCMSKLTTELLLHFMMVGKSKHVHIDMYVKIHVCMHVI